jgi:hypothetical protein
VTQSLPLLICAVGDPHIKLKGRCFHYEVGTVNYGDRSKLCGGRPEPGEYCPERVSLSVQSSITEPKLPYNMVLRDTSLLRGAGQRDRPSTDYTVYVPCRVSASTNVLTMHRQAFRRRQGRPNGSDPVAALVAPRNSC